MTKRLLIAMMAGLLIAGAARQPDRADWRSRLEALSPESPMAYFNLGEEVADAADTEEIRELARRLFRLAGALDPDRLGRSACLALADLEPDPNERRRLEALARMLDRRAAQPNWAIEREEREIDPAAATALSRALGYYRWGRGDLALRVLDEQSGAAELLSRFGHLIGGEDRFRANAEQYNAPGASPLRGDEVIDTLRLEAALLRGAQRTWADDLLLFEGRPLIEVDPTDLEDALNVDADRSVYRNGRWTSPGQAE